MLDQDYVNLKNQIIKAERRVLKELGFCVHVKHPHKVGTRPRRPSGPGAAPRWGAGRGTVPAVASSPCLGPERARHSSDFCLNR